MRRGGYGRVVIGGVITTLALSGCQLKSGGENLANGKQQFVDNCAACHTLARAGATGTTGPNLDDAFRQSRADGLGQSTFAGVVHQQILHPNRNAQVDPATGKTLPLMKPGIVTGQNALDVAAYVAEAAAVAGQGHRQARRRRRLQGRGHRQGSERDARHPRRRGGPRLQVRRRRGQRRLGDDQVREPADHGARHRRRGQRPQRQGRGRRPAAARRSSPPTSSPASTRSTAPCDGHRAGRHGRQAHRQVSVRTERLRDAQSAWNDERDDDRDHEDGEHVDEDAERLALAAQWVQRHRLR